MDLSYQKLHQFLISSLTEVELVRAIKKLSQNFTSSRESISEYLSSEQLVAAYSLFYMPTNIKKFDFLLKQLDSQEWKEMSDCEFIDYGTGPGTYLLAWLNMLSDQLSNRRVQGIDCSKLMLEQAQKNINGFFPDFKEFHLGQSLAAGSSSRDKVFCLGHSLNEMGVSKVKELLASVDPKYLIVIEPGTPASFRQIIELRNWLFDRGFGTLYPCLQAQGNCPMMGSENWCHQVLQATHDPSIERISQIVRLDRREMPVIGHIFKQGYVGRQQLKARLIRISRETKFSFEMELCLVSGAESKLQIAEVFKKSLKKEGVKQLRKLSNGSSLSFKVIKEIEKKWRVELTSF